MESVSESSITHPYLEQEEQGHLVHDMKSPFNGIVGLSEPLAKMSKDPEKKRQLTWVNVSGARWCKHIEATVESAQLAVGLVDIKSETVNVGFLVEEACALLSVAKDPRDKIIRQDSVSITNTVSYEGLMVSGSDIHTAKCIYHLLLNAIKFTDSGSITISHRVEGETHLVVIFTDTGIGMSSDQLSTAFEPFVKCTDRLPGESLGLGLTSVKEYIELVGGKILLESELGKGTTAELWIPKQASNIGKHERGPFGFGYFMHSHAKEGVWLLQKRALGILTVDLLPAHYGIAGMADRLFNSEEKPQQKKQFAMIQRSANRVVEVLSLIRDATLRSEPALTPRVIPCSFVPIAETILAELNKALDKKGQPLKQKTVEFVFEALGSLPIITADPFYVYRMVYHLCENALKFTSEGKVVLTAGPSADGGLLVTLTDSGIGFDMGKLEEIFKPFHRLEPNKFYGLGLGLCLVKDMMARIPRSSLEIDSLPGKGASVKLVLAEGTAVSGGIAETVKEEPSPIVDAPPQIPAVVEAVVAPVIPVIESPPAEVPPKQEEPVAESPLPAPEVPKAPEQPVAPVVVEPAKVTIQEIPAVPEPETLQFTFADMPKDEEDQETVKRKTLAGDKYRILVEMDDGSEPPSIQSALSNLSLAVEILKERIAVANASSSNIKALIEQIDAKYH